MIERFVDVEAADGRMDTFVVHPEDGGPFPAVVLFMDIWGLREELFDVARRVATVGYHVTVPSFWYRRGRVRFEYRDDKGRMRSILDLPQSVQDELHANMNLVTDPMAIADTGSILKFLGGEPVRAGVKGSVGYCLGGRLAILAAAFYPDDFRATASLHGTRLERFPFDLNRNSRRDSHGLANRILSSLTGTVGAGDGEGVLDGP